MPDRWTVRLTADEGGWWIKPSERGPSITVRPYTRFDYEPNAADIAAARRLAAMVAAVPALLAAAQAAVARCPRCTGTGQTGGPIVGYQPCQWCAALRAAIAQATEGEQS